MIPQRIQLSRRKGYRKPPGAIVVARPTYYGNPYRVGDWFRETHWSGELDAHMAAVFYENDLRRAREGIALEDNAATVWCRYHPLGGTGPAWIVAHLPDLRGHDLACWCGDGPCHADVLLRLANAAGKHHDPAAGATGGRSET